MDGFDDLLTSSRGLEDNPFANPFDKPRSSSPDPWASYGEQTQHEQRDEGFGTPFGDESQFGSATANGQELKSDFGFDDGEQREGETKTVVHIQEGPPLQLEEEDEGEPTTPEHPTFQGPGLQSPGFRESLDTDEDLSNTNTPREESTPTSSLQQTREPSPVRSPVPRAQSPVQSLPPFLQESQRQTNVHQTQPTSHPAQHAAQKSPAASASAGSRVVSPLDYPSPSFTQSFASLALGGESIGGWQDSASITFASNASANEPDRADVGEEEVASKNDVETTKDTKADTSLQPLFVIAVDDPEKVGDPIRPYILYTVKTKTSSPLFSKSQFSVLRRYSDFRWLYETLALNNPGVVVPPVPEKSSFGRFDAQFVQQRRAALERCVRKIANHPVLARDPDLKMFLESDTFALDIKHRKTEMAQERGGLMSSIGQAVAGPRFYEMDDWFDKKRTYLDSLETQLKGMVKAVETVAKQRSEMAVAIGEFALAIGELSGSELSKQLSHSLAVMSDVEKKAQDLQQEQALEDATTFMNTTEEYVRLIGSVRLAFTARVRCHAQWQSAEGELRRVKQIHEKARSQGRIPQERVGHSFAQIAEAERKALDAKQEFEKCGKLIKNEMSRFEEERITDFKDALESFLEGMIERQKQLIAAWENYQELLLKKVNAIQRPLTSDSATASVAA